jgi:hypothetical protein
MSVNQCVASILNRVDTATGGNGGGMFKHLLEDEEDVV